MKRTLLLLLSMFMAVMTLWPNPSLASFAPDMSRAEVADIIRRNSQLNDQQIEQLINELVAQMGGKPGQRIPIRGVLYTHGVNGALLTDTDEWLMDATIVDPLSGNLVEIDDLYAVNFHNGGLKVEFAYKWMFTFVPSGISIQELNGGIYGRGLGGTMEAFLGLEGAWMPGENRPGHLFHAAIKAGFGFGFNFPRMEFRLRNIR